MTNEQILAISKVTKPSERCHDGRNGVYLDKTNFSRVIAGPGPCNRWECQICSDVKRYNLVLHFGKHLTQCDSLYLHVKGDNWKSVQQQYRRKKYRYVWIENTILANAPGDKPMPVKEGIELLGQMLIELKKPSYFDGDRWRPTGSNAGAIPHETSLKLMFYVRSTSDVQTALARNRATWSANGAYLVWDRSQLSMPDICAIENDLKFLAIS